MADTLLSSGIPGLDYLLQGGFARNRMYLIEGVPGTGKTTLALQFLLDGRARGEPTLYITLSETSAELRAVADSHGWSLEGSELYHVSPAESWKVEDQYTLYHPAEVELNDTIGGVLQMVDRIRPSRLVIDSLSELKLLTRDALRYRRQILSLKDFFSTRDCTAFLLDDRSVRDGDLQLQSLAHGVVLLEQLPFEYGRTRRRLRVSKMRAIPAREGFHDFVIRRGGIVVFPQLVVAPADGHPTEGPLTTGLPGLDALVGGGLTWGTSTLLIGPAGSGKSTLAAQYVSGTAGRTRAVVFLFDERRETFLRRCDALGMDLSRRVADETVVIQQVEPGDMSPGEFSHRVRDLVVQHDARVVVLDSINGYLNAIPQSDAPLARLHELNTYLNVRGVSTFLVVAQHGAVGWLPGAPPLDISYLADCVILLRFFEAQGSVRRAISVMKKRTGPHESTIRELRLGPETVRVGEALTDFQGVLTGVPEYTGARPVPHE